MDSPITVRTRWDRLLALVVMFLGTAAVLLFVDNPAITESSSSVEGLFSSPLNQVLVVFLGLRALRLVQFGLARPRYTLGPRGITDGTTGRGLLLWTDFRDVSLSKASFQTTRLSKIRLHSTADICWHYNQRIPAWRRFTGARFLRRRQIILHTVAVDHNVEWLDAEIARRVAERKAL